ncbi:MAG: alpha/beta hydrolase [Burkholderiales bacterium]
MTDRRTFITAAGGAALAAANVATPAQPRPNASRSFVLVHGAWHGGWCWTRVASRLQAAGHRVFAPSLTGLGDRVHLANPNITLDTHIADVVNLIDAEELDRVILVGHSYGGAVITGVAHRVGARLAHLVYLDAIVLKDGESWSNYESPSGNTQRANVAAKNNGAWPKPNANAFGIADANDAAWVNRRMTPQPHGPYVGKVRVGEPYASLPKTFIDCSKPALASIEPYRKFVKGNPAWKVIDLPTSHDAMVTAPGPLADILLGLASTT